MFERIEKMDRRSLVRIAIAAFVGLLFFGAIAGVIRQAGWNEGFLYGLLAGGDKAEALTPYLHNRGGYGLHGWGWHPFGLIGGIFRFFFFAFLIMLFFKFIGFWRWRMHGGRPGHWGRGPWDRHSHPYAQPEQQVDQPAGAPKQPDENKPQNTSWTIV